MLNQHRSSVAGRRALHFGRVRFRASRLFVVVPFLSLALGSCSTTSNAHSTAAPKVAIIAPAPGARIVAGQPVTVVVSAVSGRGIRRISVSLAGETRTESFDPASSAATLRSQFLVRSDGAQGSITMLVVAQDADGKTSDPVIVPLVIAALQPAR